MVNLSLLQLLVGNTHLTKKQLCERIGVSERSLYRYIAAFDEEGIEVECKNGIYSIPLHSQFIQDISDKMKFTSGEMAVLKQLLEQADNNNVHVRNLRLKFHNVYGTDFHNDIKVDRQRIENIEKLTQAIQKRKCAILRNYYSPHSKTTSDRLVEPYKFMHNEGEIRCYEMSSQMCKSFKVSRVKGGVEVLEEDWQNYRAHTNYYTDMFGFSGEHQYRVTLRLGYLAAHCLQEEYGVDESLFVVEDSSHWLFTIKVCSYQGVGRFVLGLITDIELINSPDFAAYLEGILNKLTKRGDIHRIKE